MRVGEGEGDGAGEGDGLGEEVGVGSGEGHGGKSGTPQTSFSALAGAMVGIAAAAIAVHTAQTRATLAHTLFFINKIIGALGGSVYPLY